MFKEQNRTAEFGGLILLFSSIFLLIYFVPTNNFFEEIIFFVFGWIGFWLIRFKKNDSNVFEFGLLLRISLLISTPLLSQDYIRFLWDGYLTIESINPLYYKPSELFHLFKDNDFAISLYDEISNKNAYSTYFPLQQWIFYIAALTKSKLGGIIILRVMIIVFDIATYVVLKRIFQRYDIDKNKLALYWLNPLVIIEFTSNLNTEVMFIFFLLTGLLSLSKMEDIKGGFFLSLSFCSAVFSLFFLPLLLLKGGKYRWSKFLIGFIPFSALTFIPFVNGEQLEIYFGLLGKYFQTDSHSIYLLGLIHSLGYNKIEFVYLFCCSLVGMITLIISWKYRYRNRKVLFTGLTLIVSIILLLFLPLKPAYIIIPLAISLCTKLSFPLIWSGIGFLFYSYSDNSIPMGLKNSIMISAFLLLLGFLYKDLKILFKK